MNDEDTALETQARACLQAAAGFLALPFHTLYRKLLARFAFQVAERVSMTECASTRENLCPWRQLETPRFDCKVVYSISTLLARTVQIYGHSC